MESSQSSLVDHKTHRWFLQGLICIGFAGRGFLIVAFSSASRTISEYFDVTIAWEYESLSGLGAFCAIPVAVLVAGIGGSQGRRGFAVAASSLMSLAAAMATIGFMSKSSFWLIVLGWLTAGIESGIIFILPQTFSEQWFSSDFMPVSYALAFSSLHIGSAASCITFRKFNNVIMTPHAETVSDAHQQLVTRTFVGGIGIMTLMLFASAMLVCLCFNDEHEGSTNYVDQYSNAGDCCNCIAHFEVNRSLQPMTETRITLLMIANFLSTSAQSCSIVRMPEILHLLFPSISSDVTVAVYAASMGCGVLGCVLAVSLARFYARLEAPVIVTTIVIVCLSVGLYASARRQSLVGFSVCGALFSLAAAHMTMSLLMSFLTAITADADKIPAVSCYFGFFNLGMLLYNFLFTVFSDFGIPGASYLYAIGNIVPVPFLVLCSTYVCKRDTQTERHSESIDESTRLISSPEG